MNEYHKSRKDELRKVQGLASASCEQVESTLNFVSICIGHLQQTIDVSSENLEKCIKKTSRSIDDFNVSSKSFSRKILWLNVVLTIATVLGGIAMFYEYMLKTSSISKCNTWSGGIEDARPSGYE